MPSIERRSRDGRTRWRAHYRTPDGKQRNKTFTKKADAERFLTTVEASKLAGSFVDQRLSRVRVEEWAWAWLEGQTHLKPSTRERYAGVLRTHVLPRWGSTRLADVSHADIQRWVGDLAQTAPATALKAHRVLSLVLGLAVRDGRLSRNPAQDVRLPRAQAAERVYLTHAQVRELADACAHPAESTQKRWQTYAHRGMDYELLVLLLAYTGVRFGEAAALRVGRVDVRRRRIEIAEAQTTVNGRIVWGSPKNHKCRTVGVPVFVANRLAEHVAGREPGDLVFTSPLGEPLRARNFRRDVFGPAVERADLGALVPHGLRHTAASLAIAAGADVKVVQNMLGHKSATMTLDLYGHLFDNRVDEVADALDRAAHEAGVARALPDTTVVDLGVRRDEREAQQSREA